MVQVWHVLCNGRRNSMYAQNLVANVLDTSCHDMFCVMGETLYMPRIWQLLLWISSCYVLILPYSNYPLPECAIYWHVPIDNSQNHCTKWFIPTAATVKEHNTNTNSLEMVLTSCSFRLLQTQYYLTDLTTTITSTLQMVQAITIDLTTITNTKIPKTTRRQFHFLCQVRQFLL
jgi:hypothetical protein